VGKTKLVLRAIFDRSNRFMSGTMARKIVLLSDGTGNSAGQVWRTNVWRTFESLDLEGSDQVAFYDDGVGTSSFKPLAILGGVFGYPILSRSSPARLAGTAARMSGRCSSRPQWVRAGRL
jgi:hypothetical protein